LSSYDQLVGASASADEVAA